MGFSYERPTSVEALDALLAEAGSKAALLAGGTDLMVLLRARAVSPEWVVDLKRVEGLDRVEHHADGSSTFGAAVTLNRVVDDARRPAPLAGLAEAASRVAHWTLRNRATMAGNVANASPCADTVPPLCVLGATVEVRSKRGVRRLTIPEYVLGVRQTARAPDEYISAIHVPAWPKGTRTVFAKRQRLGGHDLALVNAAVLHDPDGGRLRVSVGAASPAPVVVDLDDLATTLDAEEAARRAMAAISPISDVRASAEYRTDMTGVLVRRLFARLKEAPHAG